MTNDSLLTDLAYHFSNTNFKPKLNERAIRNCEDSWQYKDDMPVVPVNDFM